MFTLDKLNLADLRLLFLAVNFKVNLGESQRRRIFEYMYLLYHESRLISS